MVTENLHKLSIHSNSLNVLDCFSIFMFRQND